MNTRCLAMALLLVASVGCTEDTGKGGALMDPRPVVSEGRVEAIRSLAERDDLNVLFILIDTLRADRLRLYGYERQTSPTLDYLGLNGGIVFRNHHAQSSWTKCSMASLWTARYPTRTGVLRSQDVLSEDAVLAAEVLREHGFHTAAMWRNGWVAPYFGFGQGFDVYMRPQGGGIPASVRRQNPIASSASTDLDLLHNGTQYLHSMGGQRWFLYLHWMDVHEYLYDPDSARFGTDYTDVYDNSILRVNMVLERLVVYMMSEGYLENTIIVVGSDHGEAFGEHGAEGHARNVYTETTHVPWIISLPFRLDPPVLVDARTENVDLWPTLFDLLGIPPLEDVDGMSALPQVEAAMRAGGTRWDRQAVSYLDQTWGRVRREPRPLIAVEEDGLRFYHHVGRPQLDRLYDLKADPDELRPLGLERVDARDRLRALAQAELAKEPGWDEPASLELDELQLNQLRALGYRLP